MPKMWRTTAAWRISTWTTLAFAVGTGVAFAIVYLFVARTIRARSDAWLSGEAEVLAQVSTETPKDHLYGTIIREVAELASRELPDERNSLGQSLNSVFFLAENLDGTESPLWVGPGSSEAFAKAIDGDNLGYAPKTIKIEGLQTSFRVVARRIEGRTPIIYLGLSDRADMYLLRSVTRRFMLLWCGTAIMGFLISLMSARHTLQRVEHISEAVAQIGSEDLAQRLPESTSRDEISRLAKTFNLMLDRIQSSVNQLRSVTDSVAHDLKSPVTSIRGRLESALCCDPGEAWRNSVAEAIEDLDRLLNLLNTTLDLAEAEARALRLDRRPTDLTSLVAQFIDLYQPAFHERHHELQADLDEHVMINADLPLLSRMLSNLFENELAHLPPDCCVRMRLRSREQSAELVIEDTGPGFPPEIITRVFDRFVRGEHSTGHGLGLAFVDAVIKAHGGAVKITQSPGGGALIFLSIPARAIEPA